MPPYKKVKGAGTGYHGTEAYAFHYADHVEFYAVVKSYVRGLSMHGMVPHLTVAQGLDWIEQRTNEFKESPGGRESYEMAVQRKAIQAQGEEYWTRLLDAGRGDVKMELEMLIGFHDGIANEVDIPKPVYDLAINKDGDIQGGPKEPAIVQA